ncbi:uncharacterized protein A4U43_UnF6890 [Asparagus officinalis]|uniref:START domain-containing protein n=1 Tax=Asparagus officinalis TaxID=4686 RepID=A0A1R3L6C3_ASPOF|nr:uncharacterized protein A4U43_UnF6890 [Asparagus officinalis]
MICERSLTPSTGGPAGPPASGLLRAEMLPSGYLIRPCEDGGSMIHIVDHVDLDVSVESLAKSLSPLVKLHKKTSGEIAYGGVRKPVVLMTFSHRLSKGFNDAVNGFTDDGWSLLGSDGVEDVTIMINWSPNKLFGSHANSSIFSPIGGGILSAKASMLLQVSLLPSGFIRYLYLISI